MPLPRKPKLVQQLVYIEGQDEPVMMTVDITDAPGGTREDMRHDRKQQCIQRARERKYRITAQEKRVLKKQK